ncbi:MAG TPA: anhydro-N-acetylmuramic acid kinase [Xanthobacteraceae bacterium]|nr:anhydro-N-acetylmuramic acid kinase [Xanthobacteraceae bacterium]
MQEQTKSDPAGEAAGASVLAIGLMSGTSQDGVDVALIDTDGETIAQFGATAFRPYTAAERTLLRGATAAAANLTDRAARPAIVAQAERLIDDAHGEAVESFLAANALERSSIAAIGFHGQTLLHRPERGLTIQIGDGAALARRLGIAVVYDFRAADVAAGGQGAPLAPIYHRALVRRLALPPPVAVLNVGGVANVTYIDGETLIACDTGPGNALLDDFLRLRTGRPLDTDGRNAAAGKVDEAMITRMLRHPFFAAPPPKSLDRNDFRGLVGDTLDNIGLEDGAATLTALTAAAVARVVAHLPRAPATWIIAGGGARNPTLLRMLAERLAPARIETAHEAGWSIDSLEAQAFAYLAVRGLRGLPLTFPGTTGVKESLTGGVVAKP